MGSFLRVVISCLALLLSMLSHAESNTQDNTIFYDSNKEISIKADLFEFDSEEQRKRSIDLARQLRCPQCQNQNLIESNSPIAKDLRLKVFEMMKEGSSEQEVVEYMTRRFGDFVLYDPVVSPKTYILWFLPILILIGGVALAAKAVKRKPNQ
ncbi:cytochrome c-type biogenesis protein [Vibrio hannami]|uniref:cytochrome c-type biogenesis protein n=1 Tax=Vibrio hannami TaxID=2717094 RepID=UPI003EB87B86